MSCTSSSRFIVSSIVSYSGSSHWSFASDIFVLNDMYVLEKKIANDGQCPDDCICQVVARPITYFGMAHKNQTPDIVESVPVRHTMMDGPGGGRPAETRVCHSKPVSWRMCNSHRVGIVDKTSRRPACLAWLCRLCQLCPVPARSPHRPRTYIELSSL